MMYLKLTDRDLIRRHGHKPIKVDKNVGLLLIRNGKAVEINNVTGNKVVDKTKMLREYMDKMIRYPGVDKSLEKDEDCIFPELCTSS